MPFKHLLRFLFVCLAFLGAVSPAHATHLRGTTISWSPTAVAGQVQFTIQYSQRQSFGGCSANGCPVGSTLTVPFDFGDGSTGNFTTQITSVNTAEDYLVSTGTLLHTYKTAGPFTAFYLVCCRVSTIKSGHDQNMRMETTVTPFASPVNHSPVVSEPAIITLPLQATTGFFITASDLDRDTLSYRLSTASEMYSTPSFSCAMGQPPGLSVNSSTGQVTWDTTQIVKAGCGYAAPVSGDLWTVQFMVQDLSSTGVVKSKVPLDVILKFVSSTEAPPTITLSNPGPITVQAGTPISFTATGGDLAPLSRVTLNVTGLPVGATATGLNQALNPPVLSTFSWTPTAAQVGSYVITYSATNDTFEQVLASVTIYVQDILPPVLSCSPPLSVQFGSAIAVPLTVSDPQADAVSVTWTVDGTLARTDTLAASNATANLSLPETFSGLGTHTVAVSATNTHNMTSTCSTTVTVTPADQTIAFGALPDMTYGGPGTALTATASSGLPVSYAVAGPCALVNGAVTATAAGVCTVTATQAGNAFYNAAPAVVQSFNVAPAAQVITLTAPSSVVYGSGSITLTATGGASGNPVLYSVTGPATLVGNVLTPTGAGSIVVTATQAGNTMYAAAAAVMQTIAVTQAPQAIQFAPLAPVVYGSSVTLAATGGASGNPVTYTVTGPATLAGNVLTTTGAGTVVVTANQAGNANYLDATAVTQSLTVNPAAQTISFAAPSTLVSGSSITLAATGGASGNPVTYTVTGPATLAGNVLTVTGAGTVVVTANQAGNANYSAAAAVTQSIAVTQAPQVIQFAPLAPVTYGSSVTLAATGGASGNPVTYTVTGPATLAGNVLTTTGTGTVVVTAHQAGNANYLDADPVTQNLSVTPAAQVITFNPPATLAYGSSVTLSATGGASGNPVTYTVTGPATLVGNVLTVTGPGNVVVTANEAGDANYSAAPAVVKTIVVSQVPQTITFNPPASVVYGSGGIVLAATGGASGNPVTYTVTGPGSLSGNVLTPTGAGYITVTANQAGNANYAAATPVSQTVWVTRAPQAITFLPPATASVNTTLTLTGTGGASGNPVTYTVTGPATVSGNQLTITGAGTVVVTANQAGNDNYKPAPAVVRSITAQVTATVTLSASSTSFQYPNSTNTTACVTLANGQAPGGTISIYDGGTLLTTQTVQGGGCIYYYIAPSPSAGTHTLTAFYNDANNLNVFSNQLVLTVALGTTTTEVDCWVHDAPFGGNIQCDANPDSGPSSGYMTYSYDGGAPVAVQMNAASHAVFTVYQPSVGTHTIQIIYPQQGNWGASALPLQTFHVSLAPIYLALSPSTYYTTAGNTVQLQVTMTSTSTVAPNGVGTVSFYDGGVLIGTAGVDANGHSSLTTAALTAGTHSFTASYSGTAVYSPATGNATVSVGN